MAASASSLTLTLTLTLSLSLTLIDPGECLVSTRPNTSPSFGRAPGTAPHGAAPHASAGHGGAQSAGAMGPRSHGVGGAFGGMSDLVHLFAKADTRPPQKGFAPRALLEARPASVAVLNQPAASGHLNSLARFAPWG